MNGEVNRTMKTRIIVAGLSRYEVCGKFSVRGSNHRLQATYLLVNESNKS